MIPAFGAGLAVSAAASGSPSTTFYACLHKGSLSRVSASTHSCRSDSTKVSWNAVGPQGTQGIQGIQGAQGQQGVQGVQGPPGLKGVTGSQGPNGDTGAPGAPGANGQSPVEDVTWYPTLPPSPVNSTETLNSTTQIEAGSTIVAVGTPTLTGDLSSCTGGFNVNVSLQVNAGYYLAEWDAGVGANFSSLTANAYVGSTYTPAATNGLEIRGDCYDLSHHPLPFPGVSVSVTMMWTHATPQHTIT